MDSFINGHYCKKQLLQSIITDFFICGLRSLGLLVSPFHRSLEIPNDTLGIADFGEHLENEPSYWI